MTRSNTRARLYLNDRDVGEVEVRGADNSWNFGDFRPNAAFSDFAPLFGQWSLLMHADDDTSRQSEAASDELRRTEYAIDLLRARMFLEQSQEWQNLTQINIDGSLIEWKVS